MLNASKRGKRALLLVTTAVAPLCLVEAARAQHELPEVKVTAPSPIVRRAPVRAAPERTRQAPARRARTARRAPTPAPTPAAPPPEVPLRGTLPIVANQFATVTVLPADEIQRTPTQSLG